MGYSKIWGNALGGWKRQKRDMFGHFAKSGFTVPKYNAGGVQNGYKINYQAVGTAAAGFLTVAVLKDQIKKRYSREYTASASRKDISVGMNHAFRLTKNYRLQATTSLGVKRTTPDFVDRAQAYGAERISSGVSRALTNSKHQKTAVAVTDLVTGRSRTGEAVIAGQHVIGTTAPKGRRIHYSSSRAPTPPRLPGNSGAKALNTQLKNQGGKIKYKKANGKGRYVQTSAKIYRPVKARPSRRVAKSKYRKKVV